MTEAREKDWTNVREETGDAARDTGPRAPPRERKERTLSVREEVQLQVALLIEREATLSLRLLDRLREERGLDVDVDGLESLEEDLHPRHLLQDLADRLEEVESEDDGDLEDDR